MQSVGAPRANHAGQRAERDPIGRNRCGDHPSERVLRTFPRRRAGPSRPPHLSRRHRRRRPSPPSSPARARDAPQTPIGVNHRSVADAAGGDAHRPHPRQRALRAHPRQAPCRAETAAAPPPPPDGGAASRRAPQHRPRRPRPRQHAPRACDVPKIRTGVTQRKRRQ